MPQHHLWAPWRIEYITGKREEGCFFCKYPAENNDRERLILYRGKKTFVVMNYYPYNNGHIMIAPYRHTSEIADLDNETKLEMMLLVDHSIRIFREEMSAQGFNVGLNLGDVAGAGVKDHLHMHVVPRWSGDTNFMPVIGNTKVISEGLQDTWLKLKKKFDKIELSV